MDPTRVQIVLVGPHGAGKTTLGRALAEALGWSFDDEIGRRLRDEALRSGPDRHALAVQPEFDRRVTEEELARDATARLPRVVETWHPGNLAYARHRSPRLAGALERRVRRALQDGVTTLVQPLRLGRAAARARLSEPGPDPDALVRFFLEVGEEAERTAQRLGLHVLPLVRTDAVSPAVALRQVLAQVAEATTCLAPRTCPEPLATTCPTTCLAPRTW